MTAPRGLGFTSAGIMYVSQLHLNSVSKHDLQQKTAVDIAVVDPPLLHHGIWEAKVNLANDSEVFVSFYSSNSLVKLVNDKVAFRWTHAKTASKLQQLGNLNGFCFYKNHLLIADRSNHCIHVINLTTNGLETIDFKVLAPLSIAVDPIRKCFYLTASHTVYKLYFVDTLESPLFRQYPTRFAGDITVQTQ